MVSPISANWAPLWRMLRSPDQLGSDGQIVDTPSAKLRDPPPRAQPTRGVTVGTLAGPEAAQSALQIVARGNTSRSI
jgi:hypothetical protein